MANNLVTLNAIEKQFAGTPVLGTIDLQIAKGEVTVLLGPSGAGKSTLLRCINLLTPPDSGTLQLGDLYFDFHNKIDYKACLKLRRQVSIVFQQFHLWPHKTVLENITLAPIVVLKLDNQVFSNLLIFSERIIEKINELRSFYVKIDGIYQKT
ncbi:MAG: amino acid ABC transporter ATP-binding protein [Gammaproteobacteria bacterium]|nr:amino acid ABC transporter ATP-binding protein [Gammaproteobacteria bacterium]